MADQGGGVIVTGAAGAIGRAIVAVLVREGRQVIAVDRVAADFGEGVTPVAADVAEEADWARVGALAAGRRVTGLVTVAAINRTGPVAAYAVADWDAMMAVNVRGVFLAVRTAVPLITAAGGGAIVNMSSVSAFIGANDGAAYHTTKGAVLSMSRALAQELAPAGIRVNSICPGWVDTPFTTAYLDAQPDPAAARARAAGMHALNRMARPADVAAAAAFLLSPAADFITGTELVVDGGFMIRR